MPMMLHSFTAFFALCLAALLAQPLRAVSLTAENNRSFDQYAREVEKTIQDRASQGRIHGFPAAIPSSDKAEIRSPLKDNPRDIGSAYIHDWVGQAFLPGASAAQLLAVLRDYDRHKVYYAPDVTDSRLVSKNGDELVSFLRIRRKKVLTVTLASEYSNRFMEAGPGAGYSLSRSTSIREVVDAGEPGERELPHGEGNGFLWRLNAYWSWQETPKGLWVECRAISLSRSTPTGLGWVVNPIVRSLPRESLESTIENTRKAVLAARKP